jgi:hypothetical protein
MTNTPNLYTLPEETAGIFGLHRFKDGDSVICQQHKSGDWITLRPPTVAEVAHFKRFGIPTVKEKRNGVQS